MLIASSQGPMWGNYKHYKKNKRVIGMANKVEKQSNIYKKQLTKSKSLLNKNKYILFKIDLF